MPYIKFVKTPPKTNKSLYKLQKVNQDEDGNRFTILEVL